MIRLLMLCRYFLPENQIGAIRPAKFAKYLNETGKYKITVIAAMPHGSNCPVHEVTPEGIEIFRVGTGRLASLLHYKKASKGGSFSSQSNSPKSEKSLKCFVIGWAFRLRLLMEHYAILQNAKRILNDGEKQFDVIFSTYNTEFGHILARWYKKKHQGVKWIADFRDSVWLTNSTPKHIKKAKCFAQKTAKACDMITAVSQGILQTHAEDFKGRETKVIYNGFDSADVPAVSVVSDGILKLAYTGDLYSGQRDLTPIFKALDKLAKEERIDISKVQVIYAGNSGGVFEDQIRPYQNIPHINKGFISRSESLALQLGSNILLLSSWCHKGDKHTLTGKYFEYLGMRRPILSVISGEETGCILKTLITEHNLGFCYEAANDALEFNMLCDFLEQQYQNLIKEGSVSFSPNETYIESFEYRNIAKEMDILICRMLNI